MIFSVKCRYENKIVEKNSTRKFCIVSVKLARTNWKINWLIVLKISGI